MAGCDFKERKKELSEEGRKARKMKTAEEMMAEMLDLMRLNTEAVKNTVKETVKETLKETLEETLKDTLEASLKPLRENQLKLIETQKADGDRITKLEERLVANAQLLPHQPSQKAAPTCLSSQQADSREKTSHLEYPALPTTSGPDLSESPKRPILGSGPDSSRIAGWKMIRGSY